MKVDHQPLAQEWKLIFEKMKINMLRPETLEFWVYKWHSCLLPWQRSFTNEKWRMEKIMESGRKWIFLAPFLTIDFPISSLFWYNLCRLKFSQRCLNILISKARLKEWSQGGQAASTKEKASLSCPNHDKVISVDNDSPLSDWSIDRITGGLLNCHLNSWASSPRCPLLQSVCYSHCRISLLKSETNESYQNLHFRYQPFKCCNKCLTHCLKSFVCQRLNLTFSITHQHPNSITRRHTFKIGLQ